METYFLILGMGILAVTILDAVGSIASRKLNFNYGVLAVFSFLIYGMIGFIGTVKIDEMAGITLTGLIALYDALVGWKISVLLKANWGSLKELMEEEDENPEPRVGEVIFMVLFGLFIGWLGTLFA